MTGPGFAGYDRRGLRPTVVHLGPGVFHRAHQAVYADAVLRTGSRTGAIHAVSLRSPAVRDALAGNGFVYHVLERDLPAGADRPRQTVRPVGALVGVDVLAEGSAAVLARLCDPQVTVVTVTVTENGYCAVRPGGPLDPDRPEIRHDLVQPDDPRSLPGLLLAALVRRRADGIPPFTVASCDNLPGNGRATARVLTDLAELRDPALATWVAGTVAFPGSMVDRMVPGTTGEDRDSLRENGIDDPWPVVTEPFSQWVLEDCFPAGRPPWERAGVELVADVTLHEQAKLRILNAAHSALAYWGLLAGHSQIWQAAADPALNAAVRRLLVTEVLPTVLPPPGWDLAAYAEQVLARFGNPALPYTGAKVAGDGSQKLAVRVMPTVRARLAAGQPAPLCARLLAAWVACTAGPQAPRFGVVDAALRPRRSLRRELAGGTAPAVAALLRLPGFLDAADPRQAGFATEVLQAATVLWRGGLREALAPEPAR